MIDHLNDRVAVVDVLYRYATGIDRRDWPLFRSCFTESCYCDFGEIGQWSGVDEIAEFMVGVERLYSRTQHRISNPVVELNDAGATASSYVHVVMVPMSEEEPPGEAFGYYDDKLVKTGDTWRIAERHFTMVHLS